MPTDNDRSLLGTLLTWLLVAVLAIAAIKVVFWTLGMAVGLGMLLLSLAIRLLPILLIGWVVLKLLRAFTGKRNDEFDTA